MKRHPQSSQVCIEERSTCYCYNCQNLIHILLERTLILMGTLTLSQGSLPLCLCKNSAHPQCAIGNLCYIGLIRVNLKATSLKTKKSWGGKLSHHPSFIRRVSGLKKKTNLDHRIKALMAG